MINDRFMKSLQNDITLNNSNVLIFTFRAKCCKRLILSNVKWSNACSWMYFGFRNAKASVVVDKLSSNDQFQQIYKDGSGVKLSKNAFSFLLIFCENYRSPNFGGPGKEEEKVEFDIKHRGSKMLSSKSSLIRRRWGRRRMQVSSLFTNHQQDKVPYSLNTGKNCWHNFAQYWKRISDWLWHSHELKRRGWSEIGQQRQHWGGNWPWWENLPNEYEVKKGV